MELLFELVENLNIFLSFRAAFNLMFTPEKKKTEIRSIILMFARIVIPSGVADVNLLEILRDLSSTLVTFV